MIITTHQDAVTFPPFTLTIKFETQEEIQDFLGVLGEASPDIKANITDNITFV